MATTSIPATNEQPVLIVWMEAPILHDELHPRCDDPGCPCWEDAPIDEYLAGIPYRMDAAKRRYLMEHL